MCIRDRLYQISQGEDGKTKVTAYSYAALWYAQKHSSSSLELLTEDDLYKSCLLYTSRCV